MKTHIKMILGLLAILPVAQATSVKLGVISGTSGTDTVDIQSIRTTSAMVASGDNSIAIGADNDVSGFESVALGQYNVTPGDNSISIGLGNESDGYGAGGFGVGNEVNANSLFGICAMAFGALNSVVGEDTYAFGANNIVSGNDSGAFGLRNSIGNDSATVFGNDITNNTASSVMIGPSNTAKVTILSTGYVGIGLGNTAPSQMLEVAGNIKTSGTVTAASDVEVTSNSNGLILKSPNGTRFRITISNAGVLTATSL
jgi:hypothetical protein